MKQTIKTLAAEIQQRWPDLLVKVDQGFCSGDRKLAGTRFRVVGKARYASRIRVSPLRCPDCGHDTQRHFMGCSGLGHAGQNLRCRCRCKRTEQSLYLLDHNNAETYRRTDDVRRWIDNYASGRTCKEKRGSHGKNL